MSLETSDVCRDREKQEESLSEIVLRQHGVVISTPLRCISVNLFKDKELLYCKKKAYCVEAGCGQLQLDLSANVWPMNMSTLNGWKMCNSLKKRTPQTQVIKDVVCFAMADKKGEEKR